MNTNNGKAADGFFFVFLSKSYMSVIVSCLLNKIHIHDYYSVSIYKLQIVNTKLNIYSVSKLMINN